MTIALLLLNAKLRLFTLETQGSDFTYTDLIVSYRDALNRLRVRLNIVLLANKVARGLFAVSGMPSMDPLTVAECDLIRLVSAQLFRPSLLSIALAILLLLLVGGELLAEHCLCRTDDLQPSIPVLCIPPCRHDD